MESNRLTKLFIRNLFLRIVIISFLFISCHQKSDVGKFETQLFPFELPEGIIDGKDVIYGYVIVPESHKNQDDKTMKIAVAKFKSHNEKPSPEPLLLLSGGPGESNITSFTKLMGTELGKMLLEKHDIVLIDVRGTYYSQPNLHCPEVFECEKELQKLDMKSDETFAFMLESVQKAHQRFLNEGINLSVFNNFEIASDIDMVMKVLNYKKYNVFGFSAGTLTAQYLLKNYSESLHAVIMTAIVDIEENLAASNSNTIETMEKIFRICETEEKYKQAYPDLENRFLQMLDSLNETPVKVEMKDQEGESYAYNITGDKIARWLTFGMYWNSQLPVTINKLLNNDFSDFIATINNATPQETFSHGLGYSIMASEFVNGFSKSYSYNSKYETLHNGLKTAWHSPQFNKKMAEIWKVDKIQPDDLPITSDVPTLMLCGEYDHVCPPKYANKIAKGLSNSYLYIFKGMTHSQVSNTSCLPQMLKEFINDPSKAPNSACVNEINSEFILP
jgi:pimeloyl-ACP methyl ester carboxylesterase